MPPTTPVSTITTGKLIAWAGVIVAAFGFLNTAPVLSILPPKWAAAVTVIGALVAKFGSLLHTDQSTNGTP
jgi:hypothetical protein